MPQNIRDELLDYLTWQLPDERKIRERLDILINLDVIDESSGLPHSLIKNVFKMALSQQENGSIDELGFYCICMTLNGYINGCEHRFLKACHPGTVITRRLGLLIKALGVSQEVSMCDMMDFSGREKVPKPYNGAAIGQLALEKDVIERSYFNGLAPEYFAAAIDNGVNPGALGRQNKKTGCLVVFVFMFVPSTLFVCLRLL